MDSGNDTVAEDDVGAMNQANNENNFKSIDVVEEKIDEVTIVSVFLFAL